MNLAELLSHQAALHPARAALVERRGRQRRVLTFAELEQASARAARLLLEAGLRPGDAVLVFQPMSLELYIALAAIFRAGLVGMFLDPRTGREHIEACCALWAPRGLIACPKAHLLRLVVPTLQRIRIKFSTGSALPGANRFSRWMDAGAPEPIAACEDSAPALVTFTSGSTGQAKAALRTHGFLAHQQRVLQKTLRLEAGEVDLTTMPTFALANLASGVTTVITGVDQKPVGASGRARLLALIRAEKVTRIGAAPAFLEELVDFCADRSESLRGLRKIYTGGGPVFTELLDDLRGLAPDAEISALYGCTEAEPIAMVEQRDIHPADRLATRNGAGLLAGAVDRAIALRILQDSPESSVRGELSAASFSSACVRAGQAGEIVVSGAHVLSNYLSAGDNLATKLQVEGTLWHRTGDAGYLDSRQRLWLLGRCCARVRDEHGTVYPFQIEGALRQLRHRGRSVLVLERGQRTLLAAGQDFLGGSELAEFLQRWEIDHVRKVDALPVDGRHGSKIDYTLLRQKLSSDNQAWSS